MSIKTNTFYSCYYGSLILIVSHEKDNLKKNNTFQADQYFSKIRQVNNDEKTE